MTRSRVQHGIDSHRVDNIEHSTRPLEATLSDLVDFPSIHGGATRLTVGAANIQTSEKRYFDSRDTKLTVRHVMASGALPPAFPAVRIDGELYWVGGILSNTPVEEVFDDKPRRNSLVFAVHVWNPGGPEPETLKFKSRLSQRRCQVPPDIAGATPGS
jgi:NTE family protein